MKVLNQYSLIAQQLMHQVRLVVQIQQYFHSQFMLLILTQSINNQRIQLNCNHILHHLQESNYHTLEYTLMVLLRNSNQNVFNNFHIHPHPLSSYHHKFHSLLFFHQSRQENTQMDFHYKSIHQVFNKFKDIRQSHQCFDHHKFQMIIQIHLHKQEHKLNQPPYNHQYIKYIYLFSLSYCMSNILNKKACIKKLIQ